MIAKDFHSMKDFPRIRGKSFVIMVGVMTSAGLSGHTEQVITWRPTCIVWHGSRAPHAPHHERSGRAGLSVVEASV
jgi:hypothetical protein